MGFVGYGTPPPTTPQYAGQGNPSQGLQGATRSQVDPGYLPGTQTPAYNTQYGGYDPNLAQQQYLQDVAAMFGPQQQLSNALGNQQITDLQSQQYWNRQSELLSGQQQQQEAGFSLQGLGLDTQSLNIQQQALARQLGELPQQYGIQQQQFGLTEQGLWSNAQQQQQGLASQLASSGNPYSVGGGWQRNQIQSDLSRGLQGVGLQRQQAGINYMEQTASMQDAQKQLGIQSQRLGISEQEITTRLNNAIHQLGIQDTMSSESVMAEISKIQQGMITPSSAQIAALLQVANLPMLTPGQMGGQ